MIKSSHNRFFPIPDFLSPHSFGLDISDESLRFTKLIKTRDGIQVSKYGERAIPAGAIESGKIKNPKVVEEILIKLKKDEKIRSVRVSLPEEQIYLFQTKLEKEGLKNIREGVEFSLEEHVPIAAQDAVFDYEILNEDTQSFEIQVAVIQRGVAESYLSVFKNSGMTISSLELESQAIARAVIKKGDLETYMVVDFGEKRTGISVVSHGVVMFTSTIDIGGEELSKSIQKAFKISFEKAEKMKCKYGLQRNTENKEMFSILLNSVSVLRDEISKSFIYWHTHPDEWGGKNPPIKKIILCGGNSNLIGLTEYFSITMKHSVELANVWLNIKEVEKSVPEMEFGQSLSFVVALGLALGDF